MKAFSEMNLDVMIVESLKRINFINATDVQERVIPIALQGKDVIVRAKTGTGKTCAFLVPIMQKQLQDRNANALIIVPTRELALQIYEVASKLRPNQRDSVTVVYGGASINVQMQSLSRRPNIIVGTPGRIIDLIKRNALRLEGLKFLILDEADTMLDMGFIEDVEFIMSKTPINKQTLLFSATMPQEIVRVAGRHMHGFASITVGNAEELVVNQIKHYYVMTDNYMKFPMLLAYIKRFNPRKAIIFVGTQYAAKSIHYALREQGIESILMHGGLTQSMRERSMRNFKSGARFLIATNVVARGIDIRDISDIINFDVPEDPRVYVHRVGRSARMDADGIAFSIAGSDQKNAIRAIEFENNIRLERIELDASEFARARAFKRMDTEKPQTHYGGGHYRGENRSRGRGQGSNDYSNRNRSRFRRSYR